MVSQNYSFLRHEPRNPSSKGPITRLWLVVLDLVSTRVNICPKFENALAAAREIKAHAPHCRVIQTVYELNQLDRDAAELTSLADYFTTHGLVLDVLPRCAHGSTTRPGPGRTALAG
ncbi:hypothetical protein [Streptomyces sp. NPDC048473]|uniref:hypothetical protein n=1 Tax=unclassified Streptomyces TaxID=2593676 RepID=UPI00371BD963